MPADETDLTLGCPNRARDDAAWTAPIAYASTGDYASTLSDSAFFFFFSFFFFHTSISLSVARC